MRFSRHSINQQRVIDLIPVANVILLLMFFFLLSWSFVLQPGVEVKLPSTNFLSASQQGRFTVTLKSTSKEDSLIFFDEKNVSIEEFPALVKQAAEKSRGDWITLNADESVPHGQVQRVVSLLMESGFHVTIATQRAPSFKAIPPL
jgi:biopolymer transport protein ExbD